MSPLGEPLIFAYQVQNSHKVSGVFPRLRQSMNDIGKGGYPGPKHQQVFLRDEIWEARRLDSGIVKQDLEECAGV